MSFTLSLSLFFGGGGSVNGTDRYCGLWSGVFGLPAFPCIVFLFDITNQLNSHTNLFFFDFLILSFSDPTFVETLLPKHPGTYFCG